MMSPRECKEKLQELHAIVIVPTYNNVRTLGTLMADLIKYASDILVVDDGCTDATQAVLSTFGFRSVGDNPEAGIGGRTCLRHDTNKGKGASLKDALVLAAGCGWKYAVTMDADGQHYPSDIPSFVETIISMPESLIVGARNLASENMPARNTFANRFSNFWYRLETGIRLEDTNAVSGHILWADRTIQDGIILPFMNSNSNP